MPITSIKTDSVGTAGQVPVWIYITCTDDIGTIEASGYLNQAAAQGNIFFNGQAALVYYAGNTMGTFKVVITHNTSGTIYSLAAF